VVARGRWASTTHLLVCRHTRLGGPRLPRGAAGFGRLARNRPSAPGGQKTERARLSYLLHWGSAPSAGEQCCRTAGCERGPIPMQVATRLRRTRNRFAASTVRSDAKEIASFSVRVHATRLRSGSRYCRAVKLLSTQIVRKQAKAIFISNNAAHCMQRRRQRFPTVRMVGEVGNGEVRAKTGDIRTCTSTVR
jgi:hypothetical protein